MTFGQRQGAEYLPAGASLAPAGDRFEGVRICGDGADGHDRIQVVDITSRNGETDSVMEKPRSILLANGALFKYIQEWLGHSDFTTTANKYARLA